MKPAHEPNKGWAYSDTNYLLLGYLIETIEKKDYYELLKAKLLSPYKLRKTAPSNKRKLANIAMAYSKLPPSFHIPHEVISAKGKYPFNPQMEWTGGGVYSTTGDLARWGNIYFTGNVFSEGLRSQMVKVNPNGEKVYGKKHSYGMGSFIYNTKQGVAYGHSGFMPGYMSIVAYYPALKLTAALQINCDYATRKMQLTDYLDAIIDSFKGESKK